MGILWNFGNGTNAANQRVIERKSAKDSGVVDAGVVVNASHALSTEIDRGQGERVMLDGRASLIVPRDHPYRLTDRK